MKLFRISFLTVLLSVLAGGSVFSQIYFPLAYKNLNWKTFESKYATVLYHEPLEKMAKRMAAVYDSIYVPVCEVYQYYPSRQTLILKDTDDYSNGAAYFFDDKIEIFATALDFPLRGNHRWLEDVISHEFTHIVQIQAAMKWNKRVPAFYFQYFGYEDVRRPDILYGYPNRLISFPFLSITVPAWLAEGTAQFNVPGLYFDYWDSHRDMILRARTLDSTLLTYSQMMSFNKTSLDGETVYNQGYNFVSYLSKTYGLDAVKQLNESLRKKSLLTISSAMEDAFGKPGDDIYQDWVKELKKHYSEQVKPIGSEINQGSPFSETGFSNWADDFDAKTGHVLIRSNQNSDYFGQSVVILMDSTGKEIKRFEGIKANSRVRFFSWKGREYLLYSQISPPNLMQSKFSDLYVWDLKENEAIRLTKEARLFTPVWDGKNKLYAISNKNAEKSIVSIDIKDLNVNTSELIDFDNLTESYPETEFHTLDFDTTSGLLVTDFMQVHGRQLLIYNPATKVFNELPKTGHDNREPRWMQDGKLLFSSDETGIFNLYVMSLKAGDRIQVTQVEGSIFQGLPVGNNQILGSVFTGYGFKVRKMPIEEKHLKPHITYPFVNNPQSEGVESLSLNSERIEPGNYRTSDYRMKTQNPISFYPVLRLDAYIKSDGSYFDNIRNNDFSRLKGNISRDLKIGTYAFSGDPLDWIQFSAGALINPGGDGDFRDWDRDIFLGLNLADPVFKNWIPVRWAVDYYNLIRQAKDAAEMGIGEDSVKTNVIYNLNQVEFSGIVRIDPANQLVLKYAYSLYSTKIDGFVFSGSGKDTKFPASNENYFMGHGFSLNYVFEALVPSKESSINPVGREGSFTIGKESNKLLKMYDLQDEQVKAIYSNFDILRYSIGYKEHIGLPWFNNTLSFWIRQATTYGGNGESFFYNYAGGFSGMRGYPFYALGGYKMAHLQMSYRFPLIKNIDKSLKMIYFDRLYGSVFTDVGNAWNGEFNQSGKFKRDAGFELRLETSSYYLMPLRIFFSGTYGFDRFDVNLSENFEAANGKTTVTYGREWQYHFGMLFNFDLGLEKWNHGN